MAGRLTTERLTLRPWEIDDAEAALGVYGEGGVARWLSPAMDTVTDLSAMRLILQQWIAEDQRLITPAGRWAIERTDDKELIGGAVLLPLPPGGEDLEMGWQLRPDDWGQGYAAEAGRRLAQWAFDEGSDEVFAVARPANERAGATARRIGMQWVGETEKYYDMRLQVFRIRPGDID
ncbi:GNAT family N-acetyltransferase [Phytohabitans flavus]|uniref:N-acetyltransferase n=1 Tax=Phytohabitans flavus TaxID=1076124 RepID=A0A6F8XT85_9ACTN|nr:GNAT family N-acetyltransferase [Phytohabitans flavus]BCB77030.1 N-acetyltransferase [Phytohabitans flavus]